MTPSNFKIFASLAVATSYFPSALSAKVPADLNNPGIPWQDLTNGLSPEATLVPTSNQVYIDECYPQFRDFSRFERTVVRLRNQTSGLCLSTLACGFENCFPMGGDFDEFYKFDDIGEKIPFEQLVGFGSVPGSATEELYQILELPTVEEWMDPTNPTFNTPTAVLHPAVAGDVVAAVRFAGENGLELSVKASGHNYAGASGKKNTLLVNTFRYKKYSPTGIVECSTDDISSPKEGEDQDFADQACRLALARGKKAFIRVGGGEAWVDVYRSVHEFNEAQENFKYHAMGGAAGTVTPMGWTFQGGLGGTTGSRLYGLGVDQVLQIEAVLPNGQHVRFGPTSWEDQEGFIYPRTTVVFGVCNQNPEGKEEDWTWGSCPTDINFDDLWFAFCGGGGGTWGIVTSIYLQLHDFLPYEQISYGVSCPTVFTPEINTAFTAFVLDYFYDPAELGISHEESAACGKQPGPIIHCYGEGKGKKLVSAWKSYLKVMTDELLGMNHTEDSIDDAANCVESSLILEAVDVFETFEYLELNGFALDQPQPNIFPPDDFVPNPTVNVLFPVSSYLADKSKIIELVATGDRGYGLDSFYCAFGGNVPFANDQANSLSKAHRDAAFMLTMVPSDLDPFGMDYFTGSTSDDKRITGFLGGNHFRAISYGPLKSDHTKRCDFTSMNEADEKCVSTQEAVWGTDYLARLEKIKEEIDRNYMFDCNKCVGNNRQSAQEPSNTLEPISDSTPDPPAADSAANPADDVDDNDPDTTGSIDESGGSGAWNSVTELMIVTFASAVAFLV